jgi:hypothetical protein
MSRRKRIIFVLLFAGFLALLALALVISLMPQQAA